MGIYDIILKVCVMGVVPFRHVSRKLEPTANFKGGSTIVQTRTVKDFGQWAYSDLMQNTERGVLAEYIVAVLLGVDDKPRASWLAYDLELPNGKTVEVKTMSKLQAWYQKSLSEPKVVIKPTRKWDPETNEMEEEPLLHADFYVICFFNAESHETADPLNLDQWEFYVLERKQVENVLKERKSISLEFLKD